MKGISIEDFPLYEQENLISTPRSIRACTMEGIKFEDLLYVPFKPTGNKYKDFINEYAFNKRERRRLGLIEQVKRCRKQLMKKAKTLPKNTLSKTQRLREDDGQFRAMRIELEREMSRTKYYNTVRSEYKWGDMRKEQTERELSANSRECLLEAFGRLEKREKKMKQKESERRNKFREQLFMDMQKREERLRMEKHSKCLRQQEIDVKQQRADAIYARAECISESKKRYFEEKIQLLNEKVDSFEKSGKEDLLKVKLKAITNSKERYEDILESGRKRSESREDRLLDDYEMHIQREEKNALRSLTHTKDKSTIVQKKSTTKKNTVSKAKKKLSTQIEKKNTDKANKMVKMQTQVEMRQKINKDRAQLKKQFKTVDKKMTSDNLERIKRRDQQQTSKLREEIAQKNKKIQEFLNKRQKEMEHKTKEQLATERKKDKAREAVDYMSIWNAWDANVITDIMNAKATTTSIKTLVNQSARKKLESTQSQLTTMSTTSRKKTWKDAEMPITNAKSLTAR